MPSSEVWRTLEGVPLQDGIVLRDLVSTDPSPMFRADAPGARPLLVRFWSDQDGDLQNIVNRHLEAVFFEHSALLRCTASGLASSGDDQYAWAAYEPPEALLSDYLREGPRMPEEARSIGIDVADGLGYLHGRDLVYCVLDPSTVALRNGRWVLADYSQLRLAAMYGNETRRLMVKWPATPPEAFEGNVTPAWDAWSLAHLMRTCVLGPQRPRPGERIRSSAAAELPQPFAELLAQCTVMDPTERCTVRQIADRLQALPEAPAMSDPSVAAAAHDGRNRSVVEKQTSRSKAIRRIAFASVTVVVALLLFLLVTLRNWRDDGDATAGTPSPAEARAPRSPSPLDMPVRTRPLPAARTNTRGRPATEAEIMEVVDRWASSFRSRDLNEHMSLYAPKVDRFFLSRDVPVDEVRRVKQKALDSAGEIRQYSLENLETKIESPTEATVTFDKTYEFAGGAARSGKVRGVLYLRKINADWRIVGERDTRVYWQRRT